MQRPKAKTMEEEEYCWPDEADETLPFVMSAREIRRDKERAFRLVKEHRPGRRKRKRVICRRRQS